MKNKKKNAVMAVAAIAMMGTSLAFFTDYATRDVALSAGTLAVQIDAVPAGLTNMAPGQGIDLAPIVFKNAGSLDSDIRVVLTATANSDFVLTLDGGSSNSTMTFEHDEVLAAGTGQVTLGELVDGKEIRAILDPAATNDSQGEVGSLTLEVYAKQAGLGTFEKLEELDITALDGTLTTVTP